MKTRRPSQPTLEVLWGDHANEMEGTIISEHLICPFADTAHALDSSDAIVGDEDLVVGREGTEGWVRTSYIIIKIEDSLGH